MFKLPDTTNWEQVLSAVKSLKWFHSFHLGNGIFTPGMDVTEQKLQALGIPEDLSGKSVLDIGCYDGFFSFECASRGGAVIAIDDYVWTPPHNAGKMCFDFLQELFPEATVKGKYHSMEDVSSYALGQFDVVLFLGVFYHLENPIGMMKRIRDVTKGILIMETLVDCLDLDRPALAYYGGANMNKDATNTFAPNLLALREILEDTGFKDIEIKDLWDINTVQKSGYVYDQPSGSSGRVVVHAR